MHPVEDVGISPWPVDMVEFSADAYAHRKQVDVKQLYNEVPQTAWVSQFELVSLSSSHSWRQDTCEVRTSSRQRAWTLSDPRLSSPARMRKKCCYGQKNFGSTCSSLSPSPTHLSHTTNINRFATLSRIKWEVYFYKEVSSFVHWSRTLLLTMFLHIFVFVYVYVYV